ncbi:MAG: outer membrane lipoprotein-sorting protein [Rhodothermaceae bacterium]|nr:outer membrane lipoprotein-sorting protein [Rhodothermaceae bacterium]
MRCSAAVSCTHFLFLPILFLLASFLPPPSFAQETALSIIEKSDQLMRGETQTGTYRMLITRPEWEREIEFDFWADGTRRSFIRIQKPQREKGVSFLRLEREMWQYVPKINRTIKIPPSMRLQSWMGSNFTNDDLVRESSIVNDYEHALLGREELDAGEAYMVELIPKPDAPVTWDRIVQWIRVDDYLPLRAEYFNERGERVRTVDFSGFKTMHGRTLPAIMTLSEDKKPGHATTLELVNVEFNADIKESVFTQQNLKRARL